MQGNNNPGRPIDELEVSSEFKALAKKLGINTLRDLIDGDIRQYKAHPDFDPLWYAELLRLLKKENLLGEFQQGLF